MAAKSVRHLVVHRAYSQIEMDRLDKINQLHNYIRIRKDKLVGMIV